MREHCSLADKKTTVAILGHRGIPSGYGGFETFAEKITECLVRLDCAVTVYCRTHYFKNRPAEYKGARLVYLPSVAARSLDTLAHTFLSAWHVILKNTADVCIVVNVGNAPWAGLLKLFGKKVIFCVDGLDWERKKWGRLARWYLRACSVVAKWVAHEIVTDAESVHEYYRSERAVRTSLIAYGTDIDTKPLDTEFLKEADVEPKKYFLYVARFEPENNPLMVVQAHAASGTDIPLVMIGDNRYNPEYVQKVRQAANSNVIFLGYIFGKRYKAMLNGALAYVRAAEVGGASPALIEAMGRGLCIIANDKPENREMVADAGIMYNLNTHSLAMAFKDVAAHTEKALALGRVAAERAMLVYNWDTIAFSYYQLIQKLSPNKRLPAGPIGSTAHRLVPGKRVLIVGAGGMLGKDLYDQFSSKYTVFATSRTAHEDWINELDVTDFSAYKNVVANFRPHVIIHAAAITSLEACRENMAEAYRVNAESVKYAAELASLYHAKLVYISSSNVFDGQSASYDDVAKPNPNHDNIYGLTKYVGELFTQFYGHEYLIVRSGWMMGGGRGKDQKFVGKVIEQILAGKTTIQAVNDKRGSITYSRDMAANLELLLERGATGIYNMASPGMASRFEVAKEIVRALGKENLITVEPVNSEYFDSLYPVHRPTSENLVSARLEAEGLYIMRPWPEAVRDYVLRNYPEAIKKPDIVAQA